MLPGPSQVVGVDWCGEAGAALAIPVSPDAAVPMRGGESTTRAEHLTADATTQLSFHLRFALTRCISFSIAEQLLVVLVLIDQPSVRCMRALWLCHCNTLRLACCTCLRWLGRSGGHAHARPLPTSLRVLGPPREIKSGAETIYTVQYFIRRK